MSKMSRYNEEYTSSEEEFESQHDHGLLGYQFEPKRRAIREDSTSSESEDEEQEESSRTTRLDNTTWCRCGICDLAWLTREIECCCCQEKENSRRYASPSNTDNSICVTNNGDFLLLCTNEVVLRNVLVTLNNLRDDNWPINPTNNRSLRYAAYRQYTWWVHHRLGRGVRRVIPACVTRKIRERFPKGPNEEYEGFHDSD